MSILQEKEYVSDSLQKLTTMGVIKKIPEITINFNEANDYPVSSIDELAADIKRNGLLHNLVVNKRADGQYYLISGERRLRAIRKLRYDYGTNTKFDGNVPCLVYEDLTPRQEAILMDSANLQARGAGGDEAVTRNALNRYIDNLKLEFQIGEKTAKSLAKEISSVSPRTVDRDRQIGVNLSPDIIALVDNGLIRKADAAMLAGLDEETMACLDDALMDAETDDKKQELVQQAIDDMKEKKKEKTSAPNLTTSENNAFDDDDDNIEEYDEDESIGAAPARNTKRDKPKKQEEPADAPVTASNVPEHELIHIRYIDKLRNMTKEIQLMNDPDIVAQIRRLDEAAIEEDKDTVSLTLAALLGECQALRRAIFDASGDYDTGADPQYAEHLGSENLDG